MRRRELIGVTSTRVIWPFAARAQPHERVQRIGVLMHLEANDREISQHFLRPKQLGWTHLRSWLAPMR